jgi:hypothetical protein
LNIYQNQLPLLKFKIMTKLLIEIPNLSDARLLLDFAQRLNAVVIKVEEGEKISPFYWLEQIAKEGGVSSIKDPVKWQKSLRKDRKLTR